MPDSQTALIVIDYNNDFVNGRLPVGMPAEALDKYIEEACDAALLDGKWVFFVNDEHPGGIDHDWPPHCDPTTDGCDIYGTTGDWYEKNSLHERVHYVAKQDYDAFRDTPLTMLLKKFGVKRVELLGLCTDICVLATAHGAFANNFKVAVHRYGVATSTPHSDAAFTLMKQNTQAEIIE